MKSTTTDIALLLIRVGLALVFMAHGWDKVTNMADTVGFFSSIGLSAFWAYVVAYVELIGGLLMLLGIGTGWAGVALATAMVGAIVMVKLSKGFLGGYEFDLMLFLSAIAISLAGAGSYTVKYLFRRG
ncbi:MAG TPA: DoxX family protein [Candidatus Paceibacterota bacterium]